MSSQNHSKQAQNFACDHCQNIKKIFYNEHYHTKYNYTKNSQFTAVYQMHLACTCIDEYETGCGLCGVVAVGYWHDDTDYVHTFPVYRI